MTLELKSLKADIVEELEAGGWTIEKLAVAQVKTLIAYRGIGRIGATKIIAEAAEILNERGLDEAGQLAAEHYYQKASLAKILTDWEESGLPLKGVALTSARALSALKGIDEALALRLISKAQDLLNRRGLYQSRIVGAEWAGSRRTNAAFDEKWLSGEAEPPPMSIRVRRNFETARKAYRAVNG